MRRSKRSQGTGLEHGEGARLLVLQTGQRFRSKHARVCHVKLINLAFDAGAGGGGGGVSESLGEALDVTKLS